MGTDWTHVPITGYRTFLFGYDGRGVSKHKTVSTKPAWWNTVQVEGDWLPDLKVGDEVALLCTPNGRIHFYLNGILIMHHTVDGIGNNQLWACLDLDGRTTTVTLLPDSAASADEVKQAAAAGRLH